MEFVQPPRNTRTPLFHGLPEVHKPDCSLRSIVSGCDGPTDCLPSCITYFIQPLANNLPSHIKDTKHFIEISQPHLKSSNTPNQCTLGHS